MRAQEEQEEHLRLLLPLFREHLPEKLVDVAFDRVPTTLPPQYLRNAMASCLAGRVVYKEGERDSGNCTIAVGLALNAGRSCEIVLGGDVRATRAT